MSSAKKVVDSTLRRILIYTAEIIWSIVLLVIICLPLAFAIPMWFQHVLFGTPTTDLAINPVVWFGADLALLVIISLGIVSIVLGYLNITRLVTGKTLTDKDVDDEEEEEDDDEDEDEPEEEIDADEEVDMSDEDDEEED